MSELNINDLTAIYTSYLEQNKKALPLCNNTPWQVVELLLYPLGQPLKEILNPYYGANRVLSQTSFYWRQLEQGSELRVESWNPKTQKVFCCNMKPDQLEIRQIPLEEWKQEASGTFDCIVLNPPFGYTAAGKKKERLENLFLSHALNCLKEDGFCTAFLPNGFLGRQSSDNIQLRKNLSLNHQLQSIVLLPKSILPTSEIFTSILYFSKAPSAENIPLYDFRNTKNIKSFLKLYRSSEPNQKLNPQELEKHQYSFLPEEYIRSKPFDFEEIPSRKESLWVLWNQLQKTQAGHLYEDHYGQTSMLNTVQCISTRKDQLKKLIQTGYDLLECELLLYCGCIQSTKEMGKSLFHLKTGDICPTGHKNGNYPCYGAGGIYGSTNICNIPQSSGIVIGRVGSFCGNVYRTWKPGFLSNNAIWVEPDQEKVAPDFLFLLLYVAHFQNKKRGGGQQYITQTMVQNQIFDLPILSQQADFLAQQQNLYQQIHSYEQELAQLELAE